MGHTYSIRPFISLNIVRHIQTLSFTCIGYFQDARKYGIYFQAEGAEIYSIFPSILEISYLSLSIFPSIVLHTGFWKTNFYGVENTKKQSLLQNSNLINQPEQNKNKKQKIFFLEKMKFKIRNQNFF